MDNITLGLQLMVVGMSTVFLILIIVIYGGKLLINIVNHLAPEESVQLKKTAATPAAQIDAQTMAVLSEVVKQITNGKGRVSSAKAL